MMDVVPSLISANLNHLLEAKVTKNEVKDALFAMDPDKAPGMDGFSATFLQICWSIVEKDLYKMVLKSQVFQKIRGSMNSVFLALIPKEKGASSFNKFRPISFCNIGYKLITKVITNRPKPILPKIIPESQGGFIQGRQIVDNFILVQEAIHSSLSRNEKGMVVKLDLANAFDRVRHSFLLKVLHKFGLTSFKYLGLPVFLKRAYSRDWLPQLEKFKIKLLAWGFSWLNITGKSVLIKSVLNSLPLVKFYVLLAPTSILREMEEIIRKKFWKGGKQNEKMIPLVNWESISKPLLEGGLNFKNLGNHNIAIGAKLIWRIIAPNPGWAQLALWKKYFKGQCSPCLDHPQMLPNTPFLKLCTKACPLIKAHAYWILGNGKQINLWTDRIMNNEPLGDCHSLQVL
eukprot:PITA_06146